MPYIHLNSSKINYQYSIGDDLFIISGIVGSSCSYNSPKVIRTKQELDLYFGRSFKERGYFNELIDNGVSLLLYKPISTERRSIAKIPEIGKDYLCFDEFPQIGSENEYYRDSYSGEKYVWDSESEAYINIKDLPENIYSEDLYESWYNRDTLRITSEEKINITELEKQLFLEGKLGQKEINPKEILKTNKNFFFLKRSINNEIEFKEFPDGRIEGIVNLGDWLSKFLPEKAVSPWSINKFDIKELVIAPESPNKIFKYYKEESNTSKSEIKSSNIIENRKNEIIFEFNFPEYNHVRATYLSEESGELIDLFNNNGTSQRRIIIRNKLSEKSDESFDDNVYFLSTEEVKTLSFYIDKYSEFDVQDRAWFAGYFYMDNLERAKTVKIINNTDRTDKIFIKENSDTDYFKLRQGLNTIDISYINDLYSGANFVFSIKLLGSEDYLYENKTWYLNLSLRRTLGLKSNQKKSSSELFEYSLDQIDTIIITRAYDSIINGCPIVQCYPRYKTEYPIEENLINNASLLESLVVNPKHHEEIINSQRTLSFTLDFSNIIPENIKPGDFICFPLISDKEIEDQRAMIWWYSEEDKRRPLRDDLVKLEYTKSILLDNNSILTKESLVNDVKDFLKKCGYYYINQGDYRFIIYSEIYSVPDSIFSNIEGIFLNSNQTVNHDILSVVSKKYSRLEFYSKTIGPSDEDIWVEIETIPYYPEKYRIIISRYNYSETYEVNLYDTPDKDGVVQSLDSIINRTSRLVECKLYREKSDGTTWKSGDPEGILRTGKWKLSRSYYEKPDPRMYWQAFNALREFNVKEDFLCIPEIELYLEKSFNDYDNLGYFEEYEKILEYTKEKNCQALIGNLNFGVKEGYPEVNEVPQERMIYKIKNDGYKLFWNGEYHQLDLNENSNLLKWQNTFIYNYNKDYENRLIYFFRDMSIQGQYPRPAYYIFLRGILSDIYSMSLKDLSYYSPIKNSFIEEDFEKAFEIKKTNYLVCDNQKFFYKSFQNHPGNGIYYTTIHTRFAIGKISRALENNKWKFLGKQLKSDIRAAINEVLLELSARYHLYKRISIVEFNMDYSRNSLEIKLELYLRELVNKPISLDIELNYIY